MRCYRIREKMWWTRYRSREKKRVSEELFEQESAKKNMALTDSAFHIQTKAAGPNQMGKRKTIVLFNNKDDQEL